MTGQIAGAWIGAAALTPKAVIEKLPLSANIERVVKELEALLENAIAKKNRTMTDNLPPIFLLSGMGADQRVFAKQKAAIPQITIPPWLPHNPHETLSDYGKRFAQAIDTGGPCVIGGASFGSMVALEMIPHLDVRGCFLIGGVRSFEELPLRIRMAKPFASLTRILPYEIATLGSKAAHKTVGALLGEYFNDLLGQVADSDASFLRWASRAVLTWDGPKESGETPIFHIHGASDFVLPARCTRPDQVVRGAGHALSMSHGDELTEFLRQHLTSLGALS
jgi:pimeloyl-ACP methyl ester carboxylesterase